MQKSFTAFYLCLIFISCSDIPNESMTIYGTYKHSDFKLLRIDGYYYSIESVTIHGKPLEPRLKWFILYNDGTLLQSFQRMTYTVDLEQFENETFSNGNLPFSWSETKESYEKIGHKKYWGSYTIKNSVITFQYLEKYDDWSAIQRKGKILNDQQIEMFYSASLPLDIRKDTVDRSKSVFNFVEYKSKPDSLNWRMFEEFYLEKWKNNLLN